MVSEPDWQSASPISDSIFYRVHFCDRKQSGSCSEHGMGIYRCRKYHSIRRFSWSINFNTAINRNKLVAYPDFSQSPYFSGPGALKIGQPLNMVYKLHYIGVDPQTGQYAYQDLNHDGIISFDPGYPDNDARIVNLTPRFFGGLGTDLSFGALKLSLFFNIKDQLGRNAFISGNPGRPN